MTEIGGFTALLLERQLLLAGLLVLACGGRSTNSDGAAAGAGTGAITGSGAGSSSGGAVTLNPAGNGPGTGGDYDFVDCGDGQRTIVSGVVRDPAGRVPVYNAVVYILSGTLSYLPESASCEACADVSALSRAFTDETGHFELEAPAGVNVPLVIQIGKWRRELVLPLVKACSKNPTLDAELTRLPRRHSEGNMPMMAVTSGQADSMPCFLRRLGIADEEFTTPAGTGHVHVFADCNAGPGTDAFAASRGGDFPPVSALYEAANLQRYDAVLLGCDDGVCPEQIPQYAEEVQRYADLGGHLFLAHWQSAWLQSGPNVWQGLLVPRQPPQLAPEPLRAQVDVSFPKGSLLADWLVLTGASSQRGELELHDATLQYSAAASPMRRWLFAGENSTPSVDDSVLGLTLATPVSAPEDKLCGSVTFTGFHVANPAQPDSSAVRFPEGCAGVDLSPQEKLLEFLLFDRPTCVGHGQVPRRPVPPAISGYPDDSKVSSTSN